jgi:hypothetical protein
MAATTPHSSQVGLGQMMALIALFGIPLGLVLMAARSDEEDVTLLLLGITWLLPLSATLLLFASPPSRRGRLMQVLLSAPALLAAILINLALTIRLVETLDFYTRYEPLFIHAAVTALSWCGFGLGLRLLGPGRDPLPAEVEVGDRSEDRA